MDINLFPLDYWHWLILGLILGGVELLFAGAYFLWIGAAALMVAGLAYGGISNSTLQVISFTLLSMALVWGSRKLAPFYHLSAPENSLNQRMVQLIGRVIVLDEAIVHGKAQVQIGDSKWIVHGPDLAAGHSVVVVGVEGVILVVEPKLEEPL